MPTEGIQLTPRDLEVIRAVRRHRCLRSTHLAALFPGSRQKLLRRLNLLYHHGYLDRPRNQLAYYERGSEAMVYALGRRGAEVLLLHEGGSRGTIGWTKNSSVTRFFLQHTLLIADVMVALEVACRLPGRIRLIPAAEILAQAPEATRAQRNPLSWRVRVADGTDIADLGVMPDQFFGLRFEDEPEGRNRAFFFLEADRASMPVVRRSLRQSSVYRKLLAYAETSRQGLHTAHFGIKHFRLLTVTTSRARVEHLLEANSRLVGGGSPIFLFSDEESLRAGNPLTHPWVNGWGETARLTD